jgi:hypothetical protein
MEDRKPKKQSFYTRGFTTFVIVMTFLILLTSGTILFFSPRGRVANWTDWAVLGASKEQWASVHYTAATLFLVIAALHISFNWKVLLGYLRLKRVEGVRLKKELIAALVVSAIFVAGPLTGFPPFGNFINAHEDVKDYWDRVTEQKQAPIPHAEDMPLTELAALIDMPIEDLVSTLREKGFAVDRSSMTLADLASGTGLAPSDIYALVLPQEKRLESAPLEQSNGRGLGRMTVAQFCESEGLSTQAVLAALRQRGLRATPDSSLRQLAQSRHMRPGELVSLIRQSMGVAH